MVETVPDTRRRKVKKPEWLRELLTSPLQAEFPNQKLIDSIRAVRTAGGLVEIVDALFGESFELIGEENEAFLEKVKEFIMDFSAEDEIKISQFADSSTDCGSEVEMLFNDRSGAHL
ncbi:MAG: hypothetical protein AAB495_01575 [Patescibacteria group bacterium]